MKAWRLDAPNVNLRREIGSKEPSARVQKVQRQLAAKLAPAPSTNWLLAGLMQRAGIIQGGPLSPVPQTEGFAKRVARMYRKTKKFLGV
jgi:hypothetical protein